MNERIKQLILQAGFILDDDGEVVDAPEAQQMLEHFGVE